MCEYYRQAHCWLPGRARESLDEAPPHAYDDRSGPAAGQGFLGDEKAALEHHLDTIVARLQALGTPSAH